MERRRFLKLAACMSLFGFYPAAPIGSQDAPRFDTRTILLLKARVAGFRYYGGERVWTGIKPGDPVMLRREPHNPHDGRAVALYWHGEKLGYLPRVDNSVIAGLIDQGAPVDAHVIRKDMPGNPWERLEVKVELHG
jgi:hypothetical protein